MRVTIGLSLAALAVLVAAGPCDPIDPSVCASPFPNDFWRQGGKLALSPETFPITNKGKLIDPAKGGWNDLDGFSPNMPITVYLGDVSLEGLPRYWSMERSLEADCPSILLDTLTGERVPHFVELDYFGGEGKEGAEQMLIMWPAKRLRESRRYIVAYTHLKDSKGAPIPPSSAYAALRDGTPFPDPDVEDRRAHFADIFAKLWRRGIEKSDTTVAWDFTTGSRHSITGRMIFMRDDAFARVAQTGIRFEIKSVANNVSAEIAREIEGSMVVPQYVDRATPGARLVLNAEGRPVYQGEGKADFLIRIPNSLVQKGGPGIILQYGHGLFGRRGEARAGYLAEQANAHGYVLAATDWIGLSVEDEAYVALMMATDLTDFGAMPDRTQQGMLHALFLMRLLQQKNFQNDPAMTFNGRPVLSPDSLRTYYGNSQGGILGSMYMAVTTDVKRGVVGVMGAPYAILLPRSHDFDALGEILKLRYLKSLDRAILFSILQLLWDRGEPGGYMAAVTSDPLPNTPTHEILLQHALGDRQVTHVGAYILGRSLNASMFESNVREPEETNAHFGFRLVKDSDAITTAGQAAWFHPGIPPVPMHNIPPTFPTDTHEGPRREKTAQDQMFTFFTTGRIINYCKGPCVGRPLTAGAAASDGEGMRKPVLNPDIWREAAKRV